MSRDSCTNALDKALSIDNPRQDTSQIAKSIESSIHAKNESNSAQYKNDIRSKVNNIKSNEALRHDLLDGAIDPETVAQMRPEDMATAEKKAEIAAIRQESTEEVIMVNTTQPQLTGLVADDLETGIMRHTGQDGIEYEQPEGS